MVKWILIVAGKCEAKCKERCIKAGTYKRCFKYCCICCDKCNCVPSGTYGNKSECPCYGNMLNSKGKPKCPWSSCTSTKSNASAFLSPSQTVAQIKCITNFNCLLYFNKEYIFCFPVSLSHCLLILARLCIDSSTIQPREPIFCNSRMRFFYLYLLLASNIQSLLLWSLDSNKSMFIKSI